ncbi:MAG: hypothetical protein H7246_02545 [Phycisphaerae bacterium]|nr:hypothetical protein [Saprospiraceae bacterium]
MKKISLCSLLLFLSGFLLAQLDSFQAVTRIMPIKGEAYEPVFSPFCSNRCWLNNQEFDIPSRHFVPKDSLSCVPISGKRNWHGNATDDPSPIKLQWKEDQYDPDLLWTFEYCHDDFVPWQERKDTLVLWRYDRMKVLQDSFVSLIQGEMTIAKPGIWVTDHQEMVLLDRLSGQVIDRAGNPDGGGRMMSLQPWGDDVIVSDRWLYLVKQHKYVPFFPLPAEMEGCKSPEKVEFHGEICLSRTLEEGSKYAYHVLAPGHRPIRLPFKPNCRLTDQGFLALNHPLTWLFRDDTLIGLDYTTGESNLYPGSTNQPLYGNQEGRFLGFYSELGLSFFDKYSCQFRVLQLPFGHKIPRNFNSDHQFIYLTYEDHWEIINFPKLEAAFRRSSVLEEYDAFEREWYGRKKDSHDDFYKTYEAYLSIFNRYKDSENPKIKAAQERFASMISDPLFFAPDTVMEQIAVDFEKGRFDPSVSCEIVQGLFRYWGFKGELQKSLRLVAANDHEKCIEEDRNYGSHLLQISRTTQARLDSLEQLKLPPDERLYATGAVWLEYCLKKPSFRFVFDPRGGLEQAFKYFRKLLQLYPNSLWADNAAYDTFQYIDYCPQATDDYIPPGNNQLAYQAFTKFLSDYPHADHRQDVLLRLAKVIMRGVETEHFYQISDEKALECLQTIAKENPGFAQTSADYQKTLGFLKGRLWSDRWSLEIELMQDTFRLQDTIHVILKIMNQTGSNQTLDSTFLDHWHEGLRLQINQLRDKGCEELWGDFPLKPEKKLSKIQAITLQPRASYQASFLLGHTSLNKNEGHGTFDLIRGGTYRYNINYHHPYLNWLSMYASGGRFFIE